MKALVCQVNCARHNIPVLQSHKILCNRVSRSLLEEYVVDFRLSLIVKANDIISSVHASSPAQLKIRNGKVYEQMAEYLNKYLTIYKFGIQNID